ncbi:hypothetical protein [Chitinophaga polysaccharea]|uniref:hypothetical protein n=1 Tax=Chitinophaga polysaccharea TaxID=1293035 RepID=UPI00115A20CB|nr:hypothetical protein [Chitinophaga polysaccharea]
MHKPITYLFRILILFLLFTACSHEIKPEDLTAVGTDPDSITAPVPVRNKKVSAGLMGTIIYSDNRPGLNEYYSIKGFFEDQPYKYKTNEYGFLQFNNDQMLQDGTILNFYYTHIPISAPIILQEGRTHFIKKRLFYEYMRQEISAAGMSFENSSENGLAFEFTNGVWALNKLPYEGSFILNTLVLNNKTPSLDEIQPGDLRGVNSEGRMVVLSPYLLAGFFPEQSNEINERIDLKLAAGKSINVKVNIPTNAMPIAPSESTLWQYNQVEGLWIEAGKAPKMGDKYYCNLSQIGFFCIAEQAPAVYVHLKLIDKNNNPLIFTPVQINIQSQDPSKTWPNGLYTNSTGELSVYVPYDIAWSITIKDNCGFNITTKEMLPIRESLWKTLEIELTTQNQAVVEGKTYSCEKTPMKSGHIVIKNGPVQYAYPIKDGKYSVAIPMCSSNSNPDFQYKIYDSSNRHETAPRSFIPIKGGKISLPDIEVCNSLIRPTNGEIVFRVDNHTYTMRSPQDSLAIYYYVDKYTMKPSIGIMVVNTGIYMSYGGESAGNYKLGILSFQAASSPSYFMALAPDYERGDIKVDELDFKGRIIKGSFQSTVTRNPTVYTLYDTTTITGTFNLHP